MTQNNVDKSKVRESVYFSWIHTIVALVVMALVMGVVVYLGFRFGKPQIIMSILGGTLLFSFLVFLFSELLITVVTNAKKADENEYPEFHRIVKDLCKSRKMIFRPRLYVIEMGVPNAMAFGPGFLGMHAIAITPELYKLMNNKELESILAHELAHIRCKDVGLNSVLSVLLGGMDKLSRLFLTGRTAFGKGPFAFLIGGLFLVFARLVFPVGHSAISQEREKSADALAALYVGTPDYLISGLNKLAKSRKDKEDKELEDGSNEELREKSFFDKLLISHPEMEFRIKCLEELRLS